MYLQKRKLHSLVQPTQVSKEKFNMKLELRFSICYIVIYKV